MKLGEGCPNLPSFRYSSTLSEKKGACVRVAVECRRMHMNREGGGMREQRCIRIIYYYYYSTLGLEVLLCLSHVNSGCVLSVSKVKKSKELST